MKPLISIIIPAYNAEKQLCRCVDSILIQAIEYIEIILIDDGSIDNTLELCNILSEKNDSIKVFHKGNGGVSSARNLGINVAQGKYIAFIDSDDYLETKDFSKILNTCMENDLDVCLYKFKVMDENGGFKIGGEHTFHYNCLYTGEEVFAKNFRASSACIAFFKSEHIKKHSISFCEEMSYSEDTDFVTHAIAYAKKIMLTKYIPYVYAFNNKSATNIIKGNVEKRLKRETSNITMTQRLLDLSKDKELSAIIRKKLICWANSIIAGLVLHIIKSKHFSDLRAISVIGYSNHVLPIRGRTQSYKTTILIPLINIITKLSTIGVR